MWLKFSSQLQIHRLLSSFNHCSPSILATRLNMEYFGFKKNASLRWWLRIIKLICTVGFGTSRLCNQVFTHHYLQPMSAFLHCATLLLRPLGPVNCHREASRRAEDAANLLPRENKKSNGGSEIRGVPGCQIRTELIDSVKWLRKKFGCGVKEQTEG